MNEVYVKLIAGKRGFKIPQDVEEILLKNLHDSVNKIDTSNFLPPMPKPTDQEPPEKDNVFITSGDAV
jgi:hypothetical protein